MPPTFGRLLFLGAIAAYFIWVLSGRARTPLQAATGLAATCTFCYFIPHA